MNNVLKGNFFTNFPKNSVFFSSRKESKILRLAIKERKTRENYKKLKTIKLWNGFPLKVAEKLEGNERNSEQFYISQANQRKILKKRGSSSLIEKERVPFLVQFSRKRLIRRISKAEITHVTKNPLDYGERMAISPEELELWKMNPRAATPVPEQYERLIDKTLKNTAVNERLGFDKTNVVAHFWAGKLGVDGWLSFFGVLGVILIPLYFYSRIKTKQHKRARFGLDPEILQDPV